MGVARVGHQTNVTVHVIEFDEFSVDDVARSSRSPPKVNKISNKLHFFRYFGLIMNSNDYFLHCFTLGKLIGARFIEDEF